jgi:hypothetical protein
MAVLKKKIKKKRQNLQRRDGRQKDGSFPPFETAGLQKTTKKKPPKIESGSFLYFFSIGGQLWNFFGKQGRKKKNSSCDKDKFNLDH